MWREQLWLPSLSGPAGGRLTAQALKCVCRCGVSEPVLSLSLCFKTSLSAIRVERAGWRACSC